MLWKQCNFVLSGRMRRGYICARGIVFLYDVPAEQLLSREIGFADRMFNGSVFRTRYRIVYDYTWYRQSWVVAHM
jgi:hypothetical protein